MKNNFAKSKINFFTVLSFIAVGLILCGNLGANGATTHSATGNEFLSKIRESGYDIELLQIVDDKYKKVIPVGNSDYLCQFNTKAELILIPDKRGFDTLSCRLSVFNKTDILMTGWTINRMHWMGDFEHTDFFVDPRNTSQPYFSVELRHDRAVKNKSKPKRLRLFVVSFKGPQNGGPWSEALLH